MNTISITTPAQLEEFKNQHELLIIEFSKVNCPGCRMLDKALASVAETVTDDIPLARVQLEVVGEELFMQHKLRQTPSLLVFCHGHEIARAPGYQTPARIRALFATECPF